jgi:hypothetical protein
METRDYFRVALSSLIRMIRHLSTYLVQRPARYETREEPIE